jgi:hypothetical protein
VCHLGGRLPSSSRAFRTVISVTKEAEVGGSSSKAGLGKKCETVSEKQNKKLKRAGGMAQVVECLPSKCKFKSPCVGAHGNSISNF